LVLAGKKCQLCPTFEKVPQSGSFQKKIINAVNGTPRVTL